jgi:ABC-type multidrug transport system fused ATPase/permease subunit
MILTAATTGAIPFLIQKTADDVFVAKNQDMVDWITAAIVVVTMIKAIAEYVGDVTVNYLGNRFIADLRIQMFGKLARADLNFIQTVHSGRLLSGFLNDATLIRATASRSMVTLGENYFKVIILVATMFYMDARFFGADPDLHAGRLVCAVAPAPQDAEIDLQIAARNRRSLGPHYPDFARHAHRARLPARGSRGGSRRDCHQSRA